MFSEEAIKLGRIQTEFEALCDTKELTRKERTQELLRICTRENVPFKSFEYLERVLITIKEETA